MEDRLQKELSRENLNRLSSDFEVELLRLIKTLNLISQSRELYKNQVEEIESISNNLKIRINDFTIKLLEIEKSARESVREYRSDFSSSADNNELNDYEIIIKEVNEFREKIDAVDKDIERAKLGHLSKLDSFYSVYNLELKASQGELDTKLSDIKELLAQAVPETAVQKPPAPEVPTAPEPVETKGNGSDAEPLPEPAVASEVPETPQSEFQRPRPEDDLPKRSINLSHYPPKDVRHSVSTSNGIIVGIIFLFFGALVGITSYYLLDYMGQDNNEIGLREEIYSDDSVAQIEEDALTTSDVESVPLSATNIAETEDTTYSPGGEEIPEASDVSDKFFEYLMDETVETASVDEEIMPDTPTGLDLYTVLGVGANVRNGPGMNHSVATVVLEGDEFAALGERRGVWIKIIAPDGTEGWISKKVVRKIN